MAPKVDKRAEGLRELAAMIADAWRRGVSGEVLRLKEESIPQQDIQVIVNLNDPECGGLYTETVKVENFLRNLKSRARKGRSCRHEFDSKPAGGQSS